MAKITALEVADELTGDEHLPIVQGLTTKRVTMAAFRSLITPFLQYWYKGERGFTGPANATYPTMAAIAASELTNLSAILAPADDGDAVAEIYTFKPGNFAGRNDVIVSDHVPATEGAWVPFDANSFRYEGRAVAAKLRETVSVADTRFAGGAKGDGIHDDTDAINAAFAYGGKIKLPRGTYRIAGRLLVTVPRTQIVLEAGVTITGCPWRYANSQNPFGSLFVVTASDCSIRGAGNGLSVIEVAGGSEANGITFLHCDGGYVGHVLLVGNAQTTTAISDDTFGSGVAIFNTADTNPSKKPSRFVFDHVVSRDWMHYGGQVWGELGELSVVDCDFSDNGKGDDVHSVGCGFAVTYGVRNLLMSRTRLNRNKRHGILQSSAGLASHNLRFADLEVVENGVWGLSFTEEGNVWSKPGVGTNGIFTKGCTIKNNGIRGTGGGVRIGTYDGAGFILNVQLDDDVLDNIGYGALIQTNEAPEHRVTRVAVNSAIIGNTIGLGIGATIDDTVRWNGLKVSANGTDVANAGTSRLISNARGFGGEIDVSSAITFPVHGDSFTIVGDGRIDTITPDEGRVVTVIFGGDIEVSNTGNIAMQTPFRAAGNSTLMIVSGAASWFEISRKINA